MSSADLITMSDAQCRVLDRMDIEMGYPMRDVASDVGVTLDECRKIVRHFHAIGLTRIGTWFSEDDSHIAGRGYSLNAEGDRLQQRLRKHMGWRALWDWRDAPQATPTPSQSIQEGRQRYRIPRSRPR